MEAEVKIKTEPVDGEIAMGEWTVGCSAMFSTFVSLPEISDSPENSQHNGVKAIKTEPGLEVKSEAFHRMDKLFESSPGEFTLFQLPDTLPGQAPEAVEGTSAAKPQKPNLCSLEHLEEGLVGKLVRYRSGRTKLVLGETVYDVDLGLTSDFQQNAVTINANSAERSANVYSLGQINAKFNVTPDWIHLFHKMTP